MTFGRHLRTLRRAKKLTLRQLAEQAGVGFTYVSKLENDRMPPPSVATIERMGAILGDTAGLLHHAERIPSDVAQILRVAPHIGELVRVTSRLSCAEFERVIRYAVGVERKGQKANG
jgi:transcriptional regulator with XRE-family HTH domain